LLNRLLVPLYVFSLVDLSHSVAESVCSTRHLFVCLIFDSTGTFVNRLG